MLTPLQVQVAPCHTMDRTRMGSAPLYTPMHASVEVESRRPPPCPFTRPTALAACLLLTVLWLWITANPIFKGLKLHVHALRIVVPEPEEAPPHPLAGVLVSPTADAAAISRWRSVLHHLHHQEALPPEEEDPSDRSAAPPFSCYGVHAQRGRRRYMEDTHAVYLRHRLDYSSASEPHLCSRDTEEGEADVLSPWALFGVFDGHGGAMASEYAASYLLPSLHSSLLHQGYSGGLSSPEPAPLYPALPALNLTSCFSDAFQRLDDEFLSLIARPQRKHDGSTALVAGIYHKADAAQRGEAEFQLVVANLGDCRAVLVQPMAPAPEDADEAHRPNTHGDGVMQQPLSEALQADEVASSADAPFPPMLPSSDATPLSRSLALSTDHKPDLPGERSFIESHEGGFVTPSRRRDVARVQGVLAVSRAIGDAPLKPWVRSEPDVRVIDLDDVGEDVELQQGKELVAQMMEEQCPFEHEVDAAASTCGAASCDASSSPPPLLLLLASDGFWDVYSNEAAGEEALSFLKQYALAQRQRHRHRQSPLDVDALPLPSDADPEVSVPPLSALAHHLVAQAYLRGSMDNLTLMAIDIRCIQRWLKKQARSARHSQQQAGG